MTYDVAVIGGGPAGLAVSIAAKQRGLSVAVLEERTIPVDKPCGEGVMPNGMAALAELGLFSELLSQTHGKFGAIRFFTPEGRDAELPLPSPGGIGVRRTVLSQVLADRARACGVVLHEGCSLVTHRRDPRQVELETSLGEMTASVMVAADGLSSRIRRAENLDLPVRRPRRVAVRQHWACAPWGNEVELHFGPGVEAYVTPVGPLEVGVAYLIEADAGYPRTTEALLRHFPPLVGRLRNSNCTSHRMGAGPLERRARRTVLDRMVLIGDAAGYVDAITGEGLSLAFANSIDLAAVLPQAIEQGASALTFAPYRRASATRYRHYRLVTKAMLKIARSPFLQELFVRGLTVSQTFQQLVTRLGAGGPTAAYRING